MAEPLIPARLARDADGTLYSETYADVYHSADGGPGQARHVFLHGNGLPARWQGRQRFVILETGFGSGLNFLSTWATWQTDPQACRQLHYLAVEKHPFTAPDLGRIHAAWPQLAEYAAQLRAAWPTLVPGYHQLELADGRIRLCLLFGDAQRVLRLLSAVVDAVFLDGFAPRSNPDMWSDSVLGQLRRLAAPDATLATWCVAGEVRQTLAKAGFMLEKRPGYGSKRQMLCGRLAAAPRHTQAASSRATDPDRHALILGAGLAGCACAYSLARRGWRVTLLERNTGPAREASGNLAGIVRPLLSRDDNIASRFTRAAFLHALRTWQAFETAGIGGAWNASGVLHVARDRLHEAHQQDIVAALAYPVDYLQFLPQAEAARLAGWPLAHGGWFFPGGGWAHPPGICAANLETAGERITRLFGLDVRQLRRGQGLWQALAVDGQVLAQAPIAILAGGASTTSLAPARSLPLKRVRGQVSHIPAQRLPRIDLAICRDGYVTPGPRGIVCAGASYNLDDDAEPRLEDSLGNLTRLDLILPGSTTGIDARNLDGRVGFRAVPPDRLPLIGQLPDEPDTRLNDTAEVPLLEGLYGLLGLASRGLVWAQLAAELLASRLADEPLPLELDLSAAVDPARFLRRQRRRQD